MRALVTGGAGFVGSHLCERLVAEGYDVICLDNLRTSGGENIAHLKSQPTFKFILQDTTEPFFIEGPIDFVLHLASPASPKDYMQHPIHCLKAGAIGSYHSLGLAKAKKATFLLASSSEVYGDPGVNPQPETYWGNVNPIGPRSVYDEAKRCAEALAMAYHRAHGVRIRIARIFNTYGPRMRVDDGRVLPNFMSQALRGEPLTIYGDGSQTRSLCYVSDLVEGLYRLLLTKTQEPLVMNLGNPEEVTIEELAKEILEVTGSISDIIHCALPQDDPKMRRPDTGRARQLLDWEPVVPRREGLRKVVPYFQAVVRQVESFPATT